MHGRRVSDDPIEPKAAVEFLFEAVILFQNGDTLTRLVHRQQEPGFVEGLGQVIKSAASNGLHRRIDRAVRGDDDHRWRHRAARHGRKQLKAIYAGHLQVG